MIDLEKARATYSAGCAEDAANLVPDLIAEIERLRADNACLSKAVISIQEERDLAQAEFRAYHKAWEEQAIEIERLQWEMENWGDHYACQMKSKAARTQELEDALVEERAKRNVAGHGDCFYRTPSRTDPLVWKCDKGVICDWNCCPIKNEKRTDALQELQAEGKIGPDAAPRSWQITEERVEALKQAAHTCHEVTAFDIAKVLRAMLTEATR